MENRKNYHEANFLGSIVENFIIVAIVFALVITVLDEFATVLEFSLPARNIILILSCATDVIFTFEFVARLIQQQRLPHGTGPGQYRLIKLHRIVLDGSGRVYSADTKLSNDYEFFELMRTRGEQSARHFLDAHFDDINVRSTVDLIAEAHAEWA